MSQVFLGSDPLTETPWLPDDKCPLTWVVLGLDNGVWVIDFRKAVHLIIKHSIIVIIILTSLTVTEAAALMRRHHVGDLVVIEKVGDSTRPIGIITDRDIIVEVIAQNIDPKSLVVKDIMSTDPVSVSETVSLLDTLDLMKQHGVRRVLVVDDTGSLLGLLAADDAIELIAEQLNDLTQLVDREIEHERKQHP